MSSYFKLNLNPEVASKTAGAALINNVSSSKMAPLPEPIVGNGIINVSKDFKWTKTQRTNQNEYLKDNIPVLHLKEFYVTQPGFVSNVQNIFETVVNGFSTAASTGLDSLPDDSIAARGVEKAKEIMGNFEQSDFYQDSIGQNIKDIKEAGTALNEKFNLVSKGVNVGSAAYMKTYENIYGVYPTGFKHVLPYFVSQWKTVNNSWQDSFGSQSSNINVGAAGKALSKFADIAGKVTSGFGMDFAKTFSYPNEGPDTSFSLILDNTYDSYYDNRRFNSYQHNWEFIFLLLYQNLPNRRNKLFYDPPVIYRAQVPGVFSYLYSYLASLSVTSIGNRQPKEIFLNLQDEDGRLELKTFKTLIPEAFKIDITLKSLLPETKNLFLNSLENKVTVSKQ
jgi:hypothetical protein